MRSLFLLPLLVFLSGCYDFAADGGGATGPAPQPAHTDVLSLPEDWSRLSPEERRADLQAMREMSAEQGIAHFSAAIAIADAELPEGVAALLMQHPQSPGQRVMVLSRAQPLDEAFVVGLTAFVRQHPPGGPTAGSVSRTSDFSQSRATHTPWPAARVPNVRGVLTQRLLKYATSVSVVDIPGIGRATLYQFD